MRAFLALLLLAAGPALAQEDPACSSSVQADLNDCAAREAQAADDDLNAVYRLAVARARLYDEGTGRTLNEELLRRAQRLWVDYRDASCNAETEPFSGGSMQPMLMAFCVSGLTQERTARLQGYADTP